VVQDSLEVAKDEQVKANGYILDADLGDGMTCPLVVTPVQFDDQPALPKRAPYFNEHGDQILTDDLGLDWNTVIDLKTKGIVT
jgi:crotonobetainyl-CoA:carnitine CoA-transferase CaiB-like acyl-CoA transferase